MLAQIAACWKDHCEQMLTIRSTFLYLDRTYVISSSGMRSLFEMGLQLYGQHLAEHPEVIRQPSHPVIHFGETHKHMACDPGEHPEMNNDTSHPFLHPTRHLPLASRLISCCIPAKRALRRWSWGLPASCTAGGAESGGRAAAAD